MSLKGIKNMKRTIMLTVVAMSLTLGSTGAYANAVWGTLTQPTPPKVSVTSNNAVWGTLTVTSKNAVWGTAR